MFPMKTSPKLLGMARYVRAVPWGVPSPFRNIQSKEVLVSQYHLILLQSGPIII
jgi:hypothetical protein